MSLPTEQANGSDRFYEYVIDNIRQIIADGELQTSQKLPSEWELVEEFNVNHVPIREALRILEYTGVLGSNPGNSTCVENTPAQSLVSKMDFSLDATTDTIRDLLELRIVPETFAAYHAAQRRTGEDVASIQKLLRDMQEAKKVNDGTEESVRNLRKLSHDFHQALVKAAHNAVLSGVYEHLYGLLGIFRQLTTNSSDISYSSIVTHEVLFNKVIGGDTERMRRCMEERMEDVHYNLKSTMETNHPGQKAVIS